MENSFYSEKSHSRLAGAIVMLVFAVIGALIAAFALPFDIAQAAAKETEDVGDALGTVFGIIFVYGPICIFAILNAIIDLILGLVNTFAIAIRTTDKAARITSLIADGLFVFSIVVGVIKFIELLVVAAA